LETLKSENGSKNGVHYKKGLHKRSLNKSLRKMCQKRIVIRTVYLRLIKRMKEFFFFFVLSELQVVMAHRTIPTSCNGT
jgi:hypothetical protein